MTRSGIDIFAIERRQHPVAVRILPGRPPNRPRQCSPAAKPRNSDRGIRCTTAVDNEKVLGLDLAVGLRKFLDAENLVEHDNARAENARSAASVHFFRPRSQPSASLRKQSPYIALL